VHLKPTVLPPTSMSSGRSGHPCAAIAVAMAAETDRPVWLQPGVPANWAGKLIEEIRATARNVVQLYVMVALASLNIDIRGYS